MLGLSSISGTSWHWRNLALVIAFGRVYQKTKETGYERASPKNFACSLAGLSCAATFTANPVRNAQTMPGASDLGHFHS